MNNTVQVIAILALAMTASVSTGQELPPAKRTALDMAAAVDDEVDRLARALWQYSEIALREERSAALLAEVLEGEGFAVERRVAGMPTAFVAQWGQGRPTIGVLAEFDALPGIGNDAVPRRQPRADGHPHGQGCGHNLFGAGSVAAAIVLKRTMERHELAGTVRLYGTPAEETVVGKVYMAKAGLFDDLDAALDWHPGHETEVNNQTGQALNNFTVEFRGKAAHGAFDPWNGRSALDAVELMNYGVNMMREHVEPTARMHYVIPAGGEAPNVVPDYARVWYYVRDVDRVKVERNYAWVLDVAAGAALATHTEHEVKLVTGVHEMLLNRPLQEAAQKNLELVGAPAYTEADQAFARDLQTFLELEPKGLSTKVEPLADGVKPTEGGSTDVAEVSWITPTVSVGVASAGLDLPWHSWATSASHGTPGASRAAQVAARVLALTGVDLLTDPELLASARAFYLEKTGGAPYRSPIPVDQEPPPPEVSLSR
jgi:aminobenzoyl-glutamate utilization protein B